MRTRVKRVCASPLLRSLSVVAVLLGACTAPQTAAPDAVAETAQPLVADVVAGSAHTSEKPRVAWVVMKERANLDMVRALPDPTSRGVRVVDTLRDTAARSQVSVQELLRQRNADFRSFWIANSLRVEADPLTLSMLAQRGDVERVLDDRTLENPGLVRSEPAAQTAAVEWSLASIRAPQVWRELGVRGEGIVIASIDSGVQYDHPALVRQYRGYRGDHFEHNYNWFDPTRLCGVPSTAPCDNFGHGTHTLGTMVGDDGDAGDNQIGVAPGATWIAAKGCEGKACPLDKLLAAAEWIMAPTDLNGQNPRPDLRPNIVNNSWSLESSDPFYQAIVQAWVAAGIFPVFAAGNEGPGCGTVHSPGDYSEAVAVGAFDASFQIAAFSSRGPSPLGAGKPNLAAPGVGVRSSIPGNEYALSDGTSMAAPHVAGTVALLWSAAPALLGDVAATRSLLDQSALDVADTACGGSDDNNNVWGEGRLDALAAVQLSPHTTSGILVGTVQRPDGSAIAGAQVVVSREGVPDRSVKAGQDGAFSLRVAPGTYALSVRAFGFIAQRVADVSVGVGVTSAPALVLTQAREFRVSGSVVDEQGRALAGVSVALLEAPLPAVTTDARGAFAFERVSEGSYELQVTPHGCYEAKFEQIQVAAELSVQLSLTQHRDAYGYGCESVREQYARAGDVLLTVGDDESAAIELPFPFVYYGRSYATVYASVNGRLELTTEREAGPNTPIPSPSAPNAAIYAYWDDLYLDALSSVRAQTVGLSPDRRVVVEWRDLLSYETGAERHSFSLSLFENGQILMQYAPREGEAWLGATATIGIEGPTGTEGVQYAFNRPAMQAGNSVMFRTSASVTLRGAVTDAIDRLPLVGARVAALRGEQVLGAVVTDARGGYLMQLPPGDVALHVQMPRYPLEVRALSLSDNARVTSDFALGGARASVSETKLSLVLPAGQVRTRKLTLQNIGTLALDWSAHESASPESLDTSLAQISGNARDVSLAAALEGATDTRHMFAQTAASSGTPLQPGSVISSFVAKGLSVAWGVGYDGTLWLSDVPAFSNTQFTLEGQSTGTRWSTGWATYYPGDMAFDSRHGWMCQVNVGGDNGIHCWDRATGRVAGVIRGDFPWTRIFQRGLAYRQDDDSFYIGGWDQGIVYHVRGLSHEHPGEVIDSCLPADRFISGLAWNASMHVLWEATNSPIDVMYELDPEDCSVLSVVPHPHPGYNGGGLETDVFGNLWTVSQAENRAYLIESDVPGFVELPWLSIAAAVSEGTLAPGQTQQIELGIDTTGLAPGVYLGAISIESSSSRTGHLRVPVSLTVTGYQRALDAGSSAPYLDTSGDAWDADRAYTAGGWGYVQASRSYATSRGIAGTRDPALYQSLRADPYAYRFDAVPNGVYQVELRFAQLREQASGRRIFDVIVEDQTVLAAHDIAYDVGSFAADDHQFFVPVDDGTLDIRFVPRDGVPVVAALRVTQRPDRTSALRTPSASAPRQLGALPAKVVPELQP